MEPNPKALDDYIGTVLAFSQGVNGVRPKTDVSAMATRLTELVMVDYGMREPKLLLGDDGVLWFELAMGQSDPDVSHLFRVAVNVDGSMTGSILDEQLSPIHILTNLEEKHIKFILESIPGNAQEAEERGQ